MTRRNDRNSYERIRLRVAIGQLERGELAHQNDLAAPPPPSDVFPHPPSGFAYPAGGVSMLAKKRRRRRAGESAPDSPTETVAAAPELKPTPPSVGSTPARGGGQTGEAEAEWEGGQEVEDDEGDDNVGAVVMPPLPSELGMEAVMSAQVDAKKLPDFVHLYKTYYTYHARAKYHTQLANISFEEVFDLTA